jgi:hypothetical protein
MRGHAAGIAAHLPAPAQSPSDFEQNSRSPQSAFDEQVPDAGGAGAVGAAVGAALVVSLAVFACGASAPHPTSAAKAMHVKSRIMVASWKGFIT